MPNSFYKEQNKYQADLSQGMYLKFEYLENSNIDKKIYVNIDFHEVI